MPNRRHLLVLAPAVFAGCAALPGGDPPRVSVAGVEPLAGEGLELRFVVKLRIQNPNDAPLDYNGVFVELDLRGQPFGAGISDATGRVPRFGEAVIGVPVTVSALDAARQVLGVVGGSVDRPVAYALRGKLAGPAFGGTRFESQGEIAWPSANRL